MKLFEKMIENLKKSGLIKSTKDEMFVQILEDMYKMYKKKSSDYKDTSSIMKSIYGENYYTMMIMQKMLRVKEICDSGNSPANEKINDSYVDCANYCVLAMIDIMNENLGAK